MLVTAYQGFRVNDFLVVHSKKKDNNIPWQTYPRLFLVVFLVARGTNSPNRCMSFFVTPEQYRRLELCERTFPSLSFEFSVYTE